MPTSTTMKIYTSSLPAPPIPDESLYTFLFRTHFDEFPPDAPAYVDAATGSTVTRGEMKERTLELAYGLRVEFARMGGVPLNRGDVLMLLSPNTIAYPLMYLGCFAAGFCTTPASPSYMPNELHYQWTNSEAKAVIVHPSLVPKVLKMFELLDVDATEARRRIIVVDWGIQSAGLGFKDYVCITDLLGKGSMDEEEKFTGDQVNTPVLLCYSSGTTGKPKGVKTTHRNFVAMLIASAVMWPKFRAKQPRMLGFLPFFHIFGCVQVIHAEFLRGVPVYVMPSFSLESFCKNVEKHKITHGCVVPPILLSLYHYPALSQYNLKSLEYLLSGAAPLSISLLKALGTRMTSLGVNVALVQGYGLTEGAAHLLPIEDWLRKAGTIGQLLPTCEARLVSEDGKDVEEGQPGEFWLRGPCVFQGYLKNEAATRESITEDGWFKTGDILTRDSEGYWAVLDRKKELIKYKGYQVPPAELESVLLEHPDIVDAGVIGMFSEAEETELPRAYVVHAKTLGATESSVFGTAVQEWIKDRVAKHKYLRGGVVVVDAIPRNPSGKILRRALRDRASAEAGKSTALEKAKL